MVPVIPVIVAAAVKGALGGIILSQLAVYAISAVAAIAASSLVGQAMKPKGKTPGADSFKALARDRSVMVRQPIVSRKLIYGEARVSGPLVYVQSTDSNNYLHLVVALAAHRVKAIGDVYLDDRLSTDSRYSGLVRIEKFLGTDDQAASANLISESGGKWTTNHRLRGIAYIYLRLKWDESVWTNGIPTVKCDVEGADQVEDPREAGSPTYLAYTRNPSLLIRHYLKDARFGLGCSDDEIDDDYFIAAANTCDEQVELAGGGSPTEYENRYLCDGVIDTANTPQEILQELLTSCGGRLVNSGGKWRLYVAAYDAPTLTFDEGDLAGPIKVRTRVSQRENFTAIKGVYVSPENNWIPSDYPAIKSEAARTALGLTEHKYRDHNLPFTVSPSMAQRLAKIELLKARQPITVEAKFNLSAFQFQAGDTINLTNERFGWSAKTFEVIEWTLAVEGDQDAPRLAIKTLLRETASTIYDWSTDEEQTVDDAPNTDLPDAFDIDPPGPPVVTEELYETTNSRGVAVKALLSWAASPHAFVSRYEPSYRLVGATDWIVLPQTSGLTSEVSDIAPGTYDFRVRAITGIGTSSDPDEATTRQEIYGLGAAPSTPTALNLQKFGGQAYITLALHPDLDVRINGRLYVRHSEALSDAEWSQSFTIGSDEGYPGASEHLILPLKSGSYLIRAVDSSGIQSENWAQLSTDGADIREFADIGTVQEDDEFSGMHDGCVAVDGIMKLGGAGLFDDIPDFDEVASLDDYGGTLATGTYEFASGLDFGTKQRARLISLLTGIVSNVNDLIDSRETNIDDWVDFDGDDGGSNADCWIEARTTDDDPASSPAVWSEWNRVDATEVYCRGVELRSQMRSYDAAYNIIVSEMRVKAEELA